MKITNLTLILAAALAFTACKGDKDSGDSGDTAGGGGDGATDGGSGDGGTTDPVIESCDLDGLGICIEFADQTDVAGICQTISDNNGGIPVTYAEGGCGAGATGECSGLTGGDYGTATGTAYYYPEGPADQEGACDTAGGTYAAL